MARPRNPLMVLWLIVGMLAGFAAIIFFSAMYLKEEVLCDLHCKEQDQVFIIMVLLSLVGVFIGSLTYYFISEKYEKRIGRMQHDLSAVFRFLPLAEKSIVELLAKNHGTLSQAQLSKLSGLSRVKVSRSVKILESKGILKKKPSGMTNEVSLTDDLMKIFV